MPDRLYNVNVVSSELLPTPEQIKADMPMPASAEEFVFRTRGALRRILDRDDPRLFVVVGPCSIHDLDAAREYAGRLRALSQRVERIGDATNALIRVGSQDGGENAEQSVATFIRGELAEDYDFRRVEVVGPSVSGELTMLATVGSA